MIDSLPSGIIRIVTRTQARPTLELALRLHPGTRRIVVLAGTSSVDRSEAQQVVREFREVAPSLEIVRLGELPMARVREAVASLPANTVIYYLHILQDGDGRATVPREALAGLAPIANAPIYGPYDTFVGRGIVGGHVYSFEAAGAKIAEVALRTLSGEPPEASTIVHDANVYMFDWRQLRRWGIDERRLPPGSIVRFRELSVWDSYRWYIVGGVAALLAQAALIAGLLASRTQRRRAQGALAERLRFESLVSELSAEFVSAREVPGQIERALERIVEALGLDRAVLAELGQGGADVIWVTHSWTRKTSRPFRRGRQDRVPLDRVTSAGRSRGQRVADRRAARFGRNRPAESGGARHAIARLGPVDRRGRRDRRARLQHAAVGTRLARRAGPAAAAPRGGLRQRPGAASRRDRGARERGPFPPARRHRPPHDLDVGVRRPPDLFQPPLARADGRGPDEDLGEDWADSVHPDDRALAVESYRAAAAERLPFTIDYRLRRWDGENRWVLDHGVPRIDEDGSFTGYVGSVIDITALNTALRAVLESTALRSAIFGSLYGQVAAIDRDGVIIAVNHSWTRFAEEDGIDPARGATVGSNYLDACRQATAQGDVDALRVLEAVTAVLTGMSEDARLEYACRSQSVERWFEMTVEPFRRPDGGAVISYIDITRRRRAEDEAHRQREELAHAQRITTLGELSASLAHEVNQPLAAIVTNAQAAIRLLERAGVEHADVSEALTDMAADAQRASAIIRRLRALSRKEPTSQKGVDLNETIDDVVTLLRYDFAGKGIKVLRAGDSIVPLVSGDPVQLQQVILNLLVNASEAIGNAPDQPREIAVTTARRAPGLVEVTVRDTGIGAKPADLACMFERFFSTKPGGLGMGLSISRSIVEAHGGRIRAEANPDRGLTLRVELPGEDASATDGRGTGRTEPIGPPA